jgi:hypothetical protein
MLKWQWSLALLATSSSTTGSRSGTLQIKVEETSACDDSTFNVLCDCAWDYDEELQTETADHCW